jgi:pyruvate/2-oxoglutarate dehydrogenase complex dihydrolipoamide acyltransferase (E2) component
VAEIRVPKFGMSGLEVEILEVLVAVGDTVEPGQPVAEAASDKVDFTIDSETGGTVVSIAAAAGDMCDMGSVLMVLRDPA